MTAARAEVEVAVEGRLLRLSNLDKVLFPEAGFTKGEVLNYYARVAPHLVRHLAGRPLTLRRFPEGTAAKAFYQKNCPRRRPEWVKVVTVPSQRSSTGHTEYCVVDDTATLIWLANLAAIELHPLLTRAPMLLQPTVAVFDLDPGPPAGFLECAQLALRLRNLLADLDLQSWPKTSGSKGMQVYVPLNTDCSFDQTRSFARGIAGLLEQRDPASVVSTMAKARRAGKVLIDWSQNHAAKSTVSVYSPPGAASAHGVDPLSWEEVEVSLASKVALAFETSHVLERIDQMGDLFRPVLELEQHLPTSTA